MIRKWRRGGRAGSVAATLFVLSALDLASASDSAACSGFDMPSMPMDEALHHFARLANVEMVYAPEDAAGLAANAVSGACEAFDALEMLLAGSGLEYDALPDGAIVLRRAAAPVEATARPVEEDGRDAAEIGRAAQTDSSRNEEASNSRGTRADEVVATGTLIRGAAPVGARLISLDRDDFDRAGFATTQQALQTLPQTLGAGANENTVDVPGASTSGNNGRGSGVNLRGLGVDKTLTLINGRRAAASGALGNFVDVSMIPLSAVKRIEILPDGASALYGSDAVAGVVNLILRDDYDGAETRVRAETVTRGDHIRLTVGQVAGKSWDAGNALVAYEYFKQDMLHSADRPFAADSDLSAFGGDNFDRLGFGNPGVIFAGGQSFAIPEGQDGTALTPADLIVGGSNSQNRRAGTSIIPSQERHSVFVAASHHPMEAIKLFVEGRYSRRAFESRQTSTALRMSVPSSNPYFVDPVGGLSSIALQYDFIDDFGARIQRGAGDVSSYSLTAGGRADFGGGWAGEAFGQYGGERIDLFGETVNSALLAIALADPDPATAFNPFGDGSNTNPATLEAVLGYTSGWTRSRLGSGNVKVDGPLFVGPGGAVKLAAGGEYRRESIQTYRENFLSTTTPDIDARAPLARSVFAVFGEIQAPIVGEDNARAGLEKLDLSAAIRFERYSDFGSTANPKFGARWSPLGGLNLRASYGKSFRAPLLSELDTSDFRIFAFPFADPAADDGVSETLFLFGGNPDLGPETATTWSAGFDFSPALAPGVTVDATYFSIAMKGRIATIPISSALQREDEYASVITRNPDPGVAQAWLDDPAFISQGFFYTGDMIEVILDGRLTNNATTDIRGVDFSLGYDRDAGLIGDIGVGVDATYVIDFKEAATPTAPVTQQVDTLGRQPGFRSRAHLNWRRGPFAVSAFVNHTGAYRDEVSEPARRINSWTTVDVTVSAKTGGESSAAALRNLTFSVAAFNLFDADPPFVNNPLGVAFDPVNASAVGRLISFQIVKQW